MQRRRSPALVPQDAVVQMWCTVEERHSKTKGTIVTGKKRSKKELLQEDGVKGVGLWNAPRE